MRPLILTIGRSIRRREGRAGRQRHQGGRHGRCVGRPGCLVHPSVEGTVFGGAYPRADEAVLTGAAGHAMRRRWGLEVGASVPLERDAPTVSVLGDTEHLAYGWWQGLRLGVTETEVVEDAPDGRRIGHERDHAHALLATSADQWVDLVDLRDRASPARRRAPTRLVLLARLRGGLSGVEQRAVLPGVRAVIGETGPNATSPLRRSGARRRRPGLSG
jgi:hypothetical protein